MADVIPGLGSRKDVLARVPEPDLRRLSLTAEEGFLLSRIERPTPIGEILAASGLPEERAVKVLKALVAKGAASAPGQRPRMPSPAQGVPAAEPVKAPRSRYDGVVFTPGELNEPGDLDTEQRKEILWLDAQLGKLSYYALLGVKPNDEPPVIRRAFQEKSKAFHPDRFFRKNLGSYKARLERIFKELARASETLGDPIRRIEYDTENHDKFTPEERRIIDHIVEEREGDDRRRADRRRMLSHAKGFKKITAALELVERGKEFMKSGDYHAALEQFKMAAELDPRREDVKQQLAEASRLAGRRRARDYTARGEADETAGDEEGAEKLYRAALEQDPDHAPAAGRLARLLLSQRKEPKLVKGFAEKAVAGEPKNADFHVTLGDVLLRLGLKKNAKREIEAALAIEPAHALAKALLKKIG